MIQKQWEIGVLLAVSIGISGCGSNQPDYCQGISGTEAMENLYYIKDNSMKVKSAKLIRAVKQICQQDTITGKDNAAAKTSTDYKACFADKLVGCGFPDKAVKALAESNNSDS